MSALTGRGAEFAPQTDAQLAFSIFTLIVGNVVIAYVIGAIGVLISSLNAAEISFQRQVHLSTPAAVAGAGGCGVYGMRRGVDCTSGWRGWRGCRGVRCGGGVERACV